uniref:Uncharacterized protein n=1 Tax=Aegilops tauschii subsp. strangulata TaxID=200361 RepID=A0A453E1G7_AEGTS
IFSGFRSFGFGPGFLRSVIRSWLKCRVPPRDSHVITAWKTKQITGTKTGIEVVAGSGAISFLPVHWDQTARGLAVPAWIWRQMDQILELGTKELEVDDSGFVLLL